MRVPILVASAFLIAACSGSDKQPGEACGPNDKCVEGYTCDPKTMTCQRIGSVGIDGGVDARPVADAGGADAKPVPDAPAVVDAGTADARIADAPGGSDATTDTTAPVVTLNARATDCASEAITFTVDDASAVYTCTLDTTVTEPCSSPFALPADIAGGTHTFSVHGRDTAGNVSADQTLTFNVDRTGPVVTITGTVPPADVDGFSDASGAIAFTTDATAVAVTCQLDTMLAADCTPTSGTAGSFPYMDLSDKDNPHTLTVVAVDSCGNPNATPAILSFKVDSTGPTICVTALDSLNGLTVDPGCAGGTDAVSGPNGDIIFTAEDTGTYTCALEGALPGVPCVPGEPVSFDGLIAGEHTMLIEGKDTHGNPGSLLFTWTVDNVGPTFTITQIRTTENTGVVTIDYFANEPVSAVTCQMDGVQCSMCSATQAVCTDLSAGLHVFTVQGRDPFGNTGPVTTSELIEVVFGPNEGRAIVIGHDFDAPDTNSTTVLQLAVEQVPYLHQHTQSSDPPLFNRKIHVVAYHQPTASATETANAKAALFADPLVDRNFYHEFTTSGGLDGALFGADVLLVYDQKDPQDMSVVGGDWENSLLAFLNAGGIVVVLDGFVDYPSNEIPSRTNEVLAPAFQKEGGILRLDSPQPIPRFTRRVISRIDDLNDVLNGDYSPIGPQFLSEYVPPINSTVVYFDDDFQQPRDVYGVPCRDCGIILLDALLNPGFVLTTVTEKIFPVYSFFDQTTFTAPLGPLTFVLNPADTSFSRIDCTATNTSCSGSVSCTTGPGCTGPICPCGGNATDGFTMPFAGAGTYEVDMRVIDIWDRPGRADDHTVTIDLPQIFVANPPVTDQTSGTAIICVNTTDNRAMKSVTLQVNSQAVINATKQGTVDAQCSGQGFQQSWSAAWTLTSTACIQPSSMSATATDNAGNSATAGPYQWNPCS